MHAHHFFKKSPGCRLIFLHLETTRGRVYSSAAMDQQYLSPGHYEDGGFNFLGYEGSPDESTSPITSTPMTREGSGESAITTYSSGLEHTHPGYDIHDTTWSPLPMAHNDLLWSPVPYANHGYPFSSTPYDHLTTTSAEEHEPQNMNGPQPSQEYPWWDNYNFITEVDQQPYWRLKPGITPTSQLPLTRSANE